MTFKYQPEWEGPLSGRSFEKQTEDFLNGIESRIDEIDTRQTPSDAIPEAPGAGSAGTSDEYSRGDHQHPLPSTISGVLTVEKGGTGSDTQNFVDLTSNQQIAGTKMFTGLLRQKREDVTIGTIPEQNQYWSKLFYDSTNRFVGGVQTTYRSTGAIDTKIYATRPVTPEDNWAAVLVGYNAAGDAYATAPTPVSPTENSTQIATTEWVQAAIGGVINVKQYGAKGNGTADDSPALRAALEAAAQKGGTVFVPAGTYLCSTRTLKIYSNTALIGEKGRTIIRRGFNTSSDSTNVLLSAAPLTGESTIHDITIENIIFDGNGNNYGAASFDLTYFSDLPTINLVIDSCDFLNVVDYHAIDLNLCANVLIRRCRFMGWDLRYNPDDSTRTQREAIQFDIYNDSSDSNRNNKVIIEQCYFGPSDNFGAYPCAAGNHGFAETGGTTYFSDVVIRDNYFDSLSFYCVHLYVFSGVVIERNVCTNARLANIENKYSQAGTTIYPNSNIVIQDNKADGLKPDTTYFDRGIYIYTYKDSGDSWVETYFAASSSKNLIIKNNLLSHYTKGIHCQESGFESVIIDGNIMEDCGNDSTSGNSINLYVQIKAIKIINNIFKRCGSLFINSSATVAAFTNYLDIASGLTIAGNSFIDPYIDTRTVHLASSFNLRGLIYKDNVIDDTQSTRTTTYQYVRIEKTVYGGSMKDNFIYTKANMGSGKFYDIATNSELIQVDNYNYINNVRQ